MASPTEQRSAAMRWTTTLLLIPLSLLLAGILAGVLPFRQGPCEPAVVKLAGRQPSANRLVYKRIDYAGAQSTMETRSCAGGVPTMPIGRRNRTGLIVDTLLFNNELDVLHARLLEYWDVVDHFVVIESPVAFSGAAKPLYFEGELCKRFAPFSPKVVHVVIGGREPWSWNSTQAWAFEREHRDAIKVVGELLRLQPYDLLLSGDADEIPYAAAVLKGANILWNAHASNSATVPLVDFTLGLYFFSLYHKTTLVWAHRSKLFPFAATEIASIEDMRAINPSANPHPQIQLVASIPDAGLHMSYFFTMDGLITKVRSFSHADAWADKSDEQVVAQVQQWVRDNTSWEPMEGGPKDPLTNVELFGYCPNVREALIEWTTLLHKNHTG